MSLRVGEIPFLCAAPFYAGLDDEGRAAVTLVRAAPRALGGLARVGVLDAAPLSAVDALALCASGGWEPLVHAGDWLGIGARGAVGSVLCFAHEPLERWSGRTVQIPPESATSVRLLAWLAARRGVRPTFSEAGEAPLAGAVARLLIGDAALAERARAPHVPVLDLGAEWQRATTLPFVFGLWVARRAVAADERARLAASLHAAAGRRAALAPELARAWEARTATPAAALVDYLARLRHQLGADDRAGLQRFQVVLDATSPQEIRP